MNVTLDTNVLVRAAVLDDPAQAEQAAHLMRTASLLVVPVAALCEFVWVLRGTYHFTPAQTAEALRALLGSSKVVTGTSAVAAGLNLLERGGDFADAVIAHQGRIAGADTFATFDRKAAARLSALGESVLALG